MAELNVAGRFLITRGMTTTSRRETWVVVSANHGDGQPFTLPDTLPIETVHISALLSGAFGASAQSLHIVEARPSSFSNLGFGAYRVELPGSARETDSPVAFIRPCALGITIDDGTSRGQALACWCGVDETLLG